MYNSKKGTCLLVGSLFKCYGCFGSSNKKVMLYNAATPTNEYIILAMKVKLPLKMVETRLKLNNPTNPQLIPPIITSNNINFFKQITPFLRYFNQIESV